MLDVIRLAADAGFDAIGVDLASVTAHGSVDDVAGAIHDTGLRCSDVLVLVPGADDDLSATARTLGRLAGAVGVAPACIAAVAAPVPWDGLVASLGECASILADHGCRLAVEFTPYSALATVSEAKQLCGAIGWDRCGLVLDSLHFFRSGAPWDELAALDAGRSPSCSGTTYRLRHPRRWSTRAATAGCSRRRRVAARRPARRRGAGDGVGRDRQRRDPLRVLPPDRAGDGHPGGVRRPDQPGRRVAARGAIPECDTAVNCRLALENVCGWQVRTTASAG